MRFAGRYFKRLGRVSYGFSKTIPDISLYTVADFGLVKGRWPNSVFTGETVQAMSAVIRLKENSNGKTGIVYLLTRGLN